MAWELSSQQDCISLALRALYGMSEASCPNFEPRAHARLTGLTSMGGAARRAARFAGLRGFSLRFLFSTKQQSLRFDGRCARPRFFESSLRFAQGAGAARAKR